MKVGLVSLKSGDNCTPIGLVQLATYLRKRNVDVTIIDANYCDIYKEALKYDVLGISAMTIHYGQAIELARFVKKTKKIPIVIGGVHISTLPQSIEPCFDAGIIGEGEEVFYKMIKSGKFKSLIEGERIDRLDDIPQPDWSLVHPNYFSYLPSTTFGEFGIEGNILTSRGCPYKCLFCSTTKFWQKLRFHSADYVVDNLEILINKHKCTHIQIWDDLFTINLERLEKIKNKAQSLIKGVKFNCQPRPNLVNDDLCLLLKEMNVTIGIFGFESGSDKILGYLKNDTVKVADNMNAVRLFRKHNIGVQGSIVIGSPGETIEDMYKTLDFVSFCIKEKVQRLWCFILTPFPGTPMWDIAKAKSKVKDCDFNWSSLACQNVNNPLLLDDSIDHKEFVKVYNKIMNKIVGMRWNKIYSFTKNNPVESFNYMMNNLSNIFNLLTKRKDV